jgi:hypothetical protein
MKALTICQPYAHLICLPDDDDRAKRVENRTWSTSYRGDLLIHAGKSRQWLGHIDGMYGLNYGIPLTDMVFGAIIGVSKVVDCFNVHDADDRDSAFRRRLWLTSHMHVEGPCCIVLTECRRFLKPIPYRGAQGLFDVPDEIVRAAIKAAGPTTP